MGKRDRQRSYSAEAMESRRLLANAIQIVTSNFEFEVGEAYSVLGRVVNSYGQPVAGAQVTARDGLLNVQRSLGRTTPQGYFTLDYSASQTQNAGSGLALVRLDAPGVARGLSISAVDSDDPSYRLNGMQLETGAGPNVVTTSPSAPDGTAGLSLAGVFGWLGNNAKAVGRKAANLVDIDSSGSVSVTDLAAIGNELVPSLAKWGENFARDVFDAEDQPFTVMGGVTGGLTIASWFAKPWAFPAAILKVTLKSIVDSTQQLGGFTPVQATLAKDIIDSIAAATDLSTALVGGSYLNPTKSIDSAIEFFDFTQAINDSLKSSQSLSRTMGEIIYEDGQPVGIDLVATASDGGSGNALGSLVYTIRRRSALLASGTPDISYVTPTLPGLPVPQRQNITIRGSGFLANSLLEFNDGTTTYRNRIPTSVTQGAAGQPDEIRYNIAVGNDTADWTVTVINGDKRSDPMPFSVSATSDDGAPAAPTNMTASYVGGVAQNVYSIDWTNPSDTSGIAKVWYKLGSAPTSNTDGLSLSIDSGKPLFVFSPAVDAPLYVWLEDGAGNKDRTRASVVTLAENPGLPQVRITDPTSNNSYSTNSNVIFLSGTSSDLAGTITNLSWTNNRGGSGTLVPADNWSSGPIQLFGGTNLLIVTATDDLGNTGSRTLTVSYTSPTITKTWVGTTSSDWNVASNWSPVGVPTSTSIIAINSGSVTISGGSVAGSIFLSSGSLTWTGGTLAPTNATIAAGGVLNISGTNNKAIHGGVLNNAGTINWTGGDVPVYSGAVINNLAGGVFDAQAPNGQSFYYSNNGAPTFNNAGTFKRSTTPGTNHISGFTFNNTGNIDASSGSLSIPNLTNNGTSSGSGALLLSGTLAGSGTLGGQNIVLNGSMGGVFTVSGTMNWTGGTLAPTNATIAAGGVLNISGTNDKALDGGVLNNAGTINWTGGDVPVYSGAVINNLAGGVFDAQAPNGQSFYYSNNGAPTFNNAGTFKRSTSAGTNHLSGFTFNSSGSLAVLTGALSMSGNAVLSGGSVSGPGSLTGGTFNLNGSVDFQNVTMNGGNLGGTGTIAGSLTWTGGSLSPTNVTVASGSVLNISGTNDKALDGGVLNNAGTINWTGGNVPVYSGAVINNLAGGVFDAQAPNGQSFYYSNNGALTFNNAGTFKRSTSAGTNHISGFTFNNSGTIDVQSGALNLSGSLNNDGTAVIRTGTFTASGGGTSGGTFDVRSDASLVLSGGTLSFLPTAVFTGSGSRSASGTLLLIGDATLNNLTFNGDITGTGTIAGSLTWTGGTLAPTNATIAAGGVLNISGTNNKAIHGGVLNNAGTINWTGGDVPVYSGAVINNLAGGVFDAQAPNGQSFYYSNNGAPTFNNAGTFKRSTTPGTNHISGFTFNNTGNIDASSGSLSIPNLTNNGTSSGSGALLLSGTLAGSGTLGGQNIVLNGSMGGVFTVSGTMNWTGGTLAPTNATIAAGGVLNISGTNDKALDGGVLNNAGTINWTGGDVPVYSGAVINNLAGGVFDAQAPNGQSFYYSNNGAPTFNNAGTFKRSTSAGTNHLSGFTFNSSGSLAVLTGALSMSGNAVLSGGSVSGPGSLTGGTFNLNGSVDFQNVTMNGGNLGGTGTIAGSLTWTGGSLSPTNVTVASGSVLNISGTNDKALDGGVLNNAGTINWTGGNVPVYSGAVINNLAGGVFDAQAPNGQSFYYSNNGALTFNNAGTFKRSTSAGTNHISGFTFNNSGTIDVQSGALNLSGSLNNDGTAVIRTGTFTASGGGTSGGTFDVRSDASLVLSGGTLSFLPTAVFTGSGSRSASGTLLLIGDATLNNLTFNGDITGTGTIAGSLTWTGGTLAPTNATIAAGGVLNISGTNNKAIHGGVLNNAGTINWTGGDVPVYSGAVINNLAGGVFDAQAPNGQSFYYSNNGAPTFNNAGTFKRSTTPGTNHISGFTFNNTGNIDASSGSLSIPNLTNNGTSSGSGALLLSGTLAGSGTLGGQNIVLNGSMGGVFTVSGTMNWTGGTLAPTNATIAAGGVLNISGTNDKALDGGVLNNAGTINWTGGDVPVYSGAVINNLAGGVFDAQAPNGQSFYYSNNGAPTFNNAGTFKRSTSAGTNHLSGFTFNSSGSLAVLTGALSMSGNAVLSGGSVSGPGSLTGGTFNLNGSVDFQNVTMNGGNLGGTGTIAGSLTWTGGSLSPTNVTVASGSVLNISGTNDKALDGGVLNNAGTINWTGGNVPVYSGAVINNLAGGVFDAQAPNGQSFYYSNNGALTFNNAGTFKRSTSAGTNHISGFTFNNSGTIDVQSGALNLSGSLNNDGTAVIRTGTFTASGGGTSGGTFDVRSDASLVLSGGTLSFLPTAVFTGSGSRSASGTLLLIGDATLNNLTFNGDITGTGTIAGSLTWTGGTLAPTNATIAAGGVLNISGTNNKAIHGGVLNNAGTINWTGGDVPVYSGAVINNLAGGVFDAQAPNGQSFYYSNNGAPTFNNAGTFKRSTTPGTNHISGFTFNNSGTIDVQSGALNLSGSLSLSATARLQFRVNSTSGVTRLNLGGSTALAGTLQLTFAPGYEAITGQALEPLSGNLSGTFGAVHAASNGVEFVATYLPDRVRLVGRTDTTAPVALSSGFEFETRHAVRVSLSESVNGLAASDFVIRDLSTNAVIPASAMALTVDLANNATLIFPGLAGGLLPNARYRLTIAAGSFSDGGGNLNTQSLTLDFHVLAGDANRDGSVNFADLLLLAQNYNQSGRTFSQGNFDYSADGVVGFSDLLILAQNYTRSLALASAVGLSGASERFHGSSSAGAADVLGVEGRRGKRTDAFID